MLDEYEKAIAELVKTIAAVPDRALTIITDPDTSDENCSSLQTILTHVIHAGYGYATSIQNLRWHKVERPAKTFHATINDYTKGIASMFSFTEDVFKEIEDDELEQNDNALKIKTGWGQLYDIEQLTEHAIVHILRHRRQIEKIIIAVTF